MNDIWLTLANKPQRAMYLAKVLQGLCEEDIDQTGGAYELEVRANSNGEIEIGRFEETNKKTVARRN